MFAAAAKKKKKKACDSSKSDRSGFRRVGFYNSQDSLAGHVISSSDKQIILISAFFIKAMS